MRGRGVDAVIETEGRVMHYHGYDVLPEVEMVPEGELFGGTWIISRCCFGKAGPEGYEVRSLLSDNDHFPTQWAAVKAARLRAIRTIDIEEVGALHLAPARSTAIQARRP